MGYIVSARIIEVNPKGESCPQTGSTRELKDAQKLMGCLASLSRFISQLSERGFPLYVLLHKTPNWQWTQEALQAFNDLKNFLTQPHILVSPLDEQSLLLYIVATTQVVSVVVVLERKEVGHMQSIQWLVYSIMCTPYGCTTWFTQLGPASATLSRTSQSIKFDILVWFVRFAKTSFL